MDIQLINWEQMYRDRELWEKYMLFTPEEKKLLDMFSYPGGYNILTHLTNAKNYATIIGAYEHSIRAQISKRLTYLFLEHAATLEEWRKVWLFYDNLPYRDILSQQDTTVKLLLYPRTYDTVNIKHENRDWVVDKLPGEDLHGWSRYRVLHTRLSPFDNATPLPDGGQKEMLNFYGIIDLLSGKVVTPCIFDNILNDFVLVDETVYAIVRLNKSFIIRVKDGGVVSHTVDDPFCIGIAKNGSVVTGERLNTYSRYPLFIEPVNYKELFPIEELAYHLKLPGAPSYLKSKSSKSIDRLMQDKILQENTITVLKNRIEDFNPTFEEAEKELDALHLDNSIVLGDKQFKYIDLLKKENPACYKEDVISMQSRDNFPKWRNYRKWVKELEEQKRLHTNTMHCIEDYTIPEWGGVSNDEI